MRLTGPWPCESCRGEGRTTTMAMGTLPCWRCGGHGRLLCAVDGCSEIATYSRDGDALCDAHAAQRRGEP